MHDDDDVTRHIKIQHINYAAKHAHDCNIPHTREEACGQAGTARVQGRGCSRGAFTDGGFPSPLPGEGVGGTLVGGLIKPTCANGRRIRVDSLGRVPGLAL